MHRKPDVLEPAYLRKWIEKGQEVPISRWEPGFFLALSLLIGGLALSRRRTDDLGALVVPILAIVAALAAWCIAVMRYRIVFCEHGILYRRIKGWHHLPWKQVRYIQINERHDSDDQSFLRVKRYNLVIEGPDVQLRCTVDSDDWCRARLNKWLRDRPTAAVVADGTQGTVEEPSDPTSDPNERRQNIQRAHHALRMDSIVRAILITLGAGVMIFLLLVWILRWFG